MLTYDTKALARLEKLYSTPQIVAQRRRLREIIAARPGESGLDVGCGVGYLACELAKEVTPGGRIAAIDNSRDAVDASKVRIANGELNGLVDVRAGDAAHLDFPDNAFDFIVGAQVYCYVPDISQALREAARVLRPGGRLVILDTDWDMWTWASADPALTRRMIAARASVQFAHAHLPRELPRMIQAAALRLVDTHAFSVIESRYDAGSFGAGTIASTRDAALKHGIAPADVARWVEDMESRRSEGEWFFCLNRFVFVATK